MCGQWVALSSSVGSGCVSLACRLPLDRPFFSGCRQRHTRELGGIQSVSAKHLFATSTRGLSSKSWLKLETPLHYSGCLSVLVCRSGPGGLGIDCEGKQSFLGRVKARVVRSIFVGNDSRRSECADCLEGLSGERPGHYSLCHLSKRRLCFLQWCRSEARQGKA